MAGAADEKREKIRANKVVLYPIVEPKDARSACTETKLDRLDETCENLHVAAYFQIALSFVVGLRMLADAINRTGSSWTSRFPLVFRLSDALILEWLCISLFALAFLHRRARIRDEKLRSSAEAARRQCTEAGSAT